MCITFHKFEPQIYIITSRFIENFKAKSFSCLKMYAVIFHSGKLKTFAKILIDSLPNEMKLDQNFSLLLKFKFWFSYSSCFTSAQLLYIKQVRNKEILVPFAKERRKKASKENLQCTQLQLSFFLVLLPFYSYTFS